MVTTDATNNRTATRIALALILSSSAFALGACGDAGGTAGESVVELESDYPGFTQKGLLREAALVAEGRVVSAEPTVLQPQFEGDSPQDDPLLGLSEEERAEAAQEDDGVVATAVTFEITVAHRGSVSPGQQVTIIQTGGVLDGITYMDGDIARLDVGSNYLLFGGDSLDGAYYILGGAAGTYRSVGNGRFRPVNPEMAPFGELQRSEVAQAVTVTR